MRAVRISLLMSTVLLSSCSTPESRPSPPLPAPVPAQTCGCNMQCDAMWAAGLQILPELSRMRIRIATDSMAETYATSDFLHITGRINKVPIGNGQYNIISQFQPYAQIYEAQRLAYANTVSFNSYVRSVKNATPCVSKNDSNK